MKDLNIEKRLTSIEVYNKWHTRLITALYVLLGLFLLNLLSKVTITGFSVINTQEVSTMDWSVFTPLIGVGAALGRSILGWAKASFADGYLQDFEIKKLGETVIRVGLIGVIVVYFPGAQQHLSVVQMGAITMAGDLLLQAVKKRRNLPAA